jgi:putative mismatch repair-like protein
MEFKIDEQTLNDLELFNQALDGKSIFSCFNTACSDGGKACIRKMLENPLTDVNKIRERAEAIRYLGQLPFFLDIRREELSFIEVYLQQEDVPQRSMYRLTSRAVKGWLKPDNDCYLRQRAVPYLGRLIRELGTFMDELSAGKVPEMIRDMQQRVKETLARKGMQYLMSQKKDSFWTRESLDLYFRGRELDGVRVILDTLYMLDSLRSLGTMAKDEGLTFPIFTGSERRVRIEGLYHLFLENPVKNDVLFDDRQHLCFLTGPNMAGKSTCMKAFGVAVYLAHCGLPVPAARMELSVFKGLFTTINLSDNLSLGYSHYYNEVARVKYIVEQVRDLQNVVVVFDELFRGTNVKDAYDASCAVIGGLARLKYGVFMISTHIVEVAEFLKPFPSVCFRFFEIDMTTGEPRYTYCLREGVSDERIGMYILKKAGVVDLIEAL